MVTRFSRLVTSMALASLGLGGCTTARTHTAVTPIPRSVQTSSRPPEVAATPTARSGQTLRPKAKRATPGKPVQLAAATDAAGKVASPEAAMNPGATGSAEDTTTPAVDSDTQAIDLTTALMLTSGDSPQIAFAKSRIEEALAQQDRAEALWLPSIRAGVNYNKHEGRIQDVGGRIIDTSRGSFFTGLGANAVGAGSPGVPGLLATFHFADAIFQPRIAERTACARQAGAQAATNDALLQTALAYVDLLRAEQDLAVAREMTLLAEELARVTGEYARTGQGLESDADRAQVELSLRKNEVLRAEETASVAAARLAEQVHWTSGQRLVPAEARLIPVELVPPELPAQGLVAQALMNRPEVSESHHLIGEAVERLRRERSAPLVPSVLLGMSYGGLGGGLGSNLTNFGDRLDADAIAYWEVRNLGVGERAVKREAQSRIDQARQRELMTLDRIAREVVESQAQVASRKQQIATAREGVEAAQRSFDRNWARIQAGQGLPIEVLQSLQALSAARRDYVRTLADYTSAQFSLHRALGWPATPGEVTNTQGDS